MPKPPFYRVTVAPTPRVLLPPSASAPAGGGVAWRRTRAVQGADLEGPWMLRVTVRLPLESRPLAGVVHGCRWLGALHVRWLCHMGLRSAAPYTGPARPAWAAFSARAPGDVVVGHRKVCSTSEVIGRGQVLLVATTLLQPAPWDVLGDALAVPKRDLGELQEASLAASMLLGQRVEPVEWAANLRRRMFVALGVPESLGLH